jgi:hypothetical protein
MTGYRVLAKRLFFAAGVAGTLLGGAALHVPAAGADSGRPLLPIAAAPSGGGAGTTTAPGSNPSGSTAPLVLSAISFDPGGTEAWVSFTSSQPTSAWVTAKPASVVAPDAPVATHPGGSGGPPPLVPPSTSHRVQLTNLKSNTTYVTTVLAETPDGVSVTQQAQFTTLKERVRITAESVDITQGAAVYGDNTVMWTFDVKWGPASGYHPPSANGATSTCYPSTDSGSPQGGICQSASHGDGSLQVRNNYGQPLSWIFAEENFDFMPSTFAFDGTATDTDLLTYPRNYTPGCPPGPDNGDVPQGVESATKTITICVNDPSSQLNTTVTFRLDLFYDNASYPARQRNAPTDPWKVPGA